MMTNHNGIKSLPLVVCRRPFPKSICKQETQDGECECGPNQRCRSRYEEPMHAIREPTEGYAGCVTNERRETDQHWEGLSAVQ